MEKLRTYLVFTPSGQDALSAIRANVSNLGTLSLQDEHYRTIAAYPAGQWVKCYVQHPPKKPSRKKVA